MRELIRDWWLPAVTVLVAVILLVRNVSALTP